MNHLRILYILLVIPLIACSAVKSEPTNTPTPTTPPLACKENTCFKDAYLQIVGKNLFIQFDLVDQNGEVNFAEVPTLKSEISFALFLEQSGEDEFLGAFKIDPHNALFKCYGGNDMPWSNGRLAAACGLATPLSSLQIRPKYGDPVRLEIISPAYNRPVIWLPSE